MVFLVCVVGGVGDESRLGNQMDSDRHCQTHQCAGMKEQNTTIKSAHTHVTEDELHGDRCQCLQFVYEIR